MRHMVMIAAMLALTGSGTALAVAQETASAPTTAAPSAPYVTRDLTFPSGDVQLSGRLYAPIGKSRFPVVVMVSGSGNESEMGGVYTRVLSAAFARKGIGTLAYDKRGTGKSGGKFTGSDFPLLGADAAAAIRFARQLTGVEQVGVWGISQAGWVIPYALREKPGARFTILVSPAGINPHEQVSFYMYGQALALGLSKADAAKAESMHRSTALYYASGRGWKAAQAEIDSHRSRPWFKSVVTHPFWDEMPTEGVLLKPRELAAAVAKRPGAFELYRSASSFQDYRSVYAALNVPTLVIYGAADDLVPIDRSRAVIEPALRRNGVPFEIKVFDDASHDIQSPDQRVMPAYLDLISSWAARQFGRGG